MIVHKGNPDASLYDESCNGVWCLMKNCYGNETWGTSASNTEYANSRINAWLNNDFLATLDAEVDSAIKRVKIPYCVRAGSSTINYLADGLSCKCFLLGGYELGGAGVSEYLPVDGAKLDYFENGIETSANNRRVATVATETALWWMRSPYAGANSYVWQVGQQGAFSSANYANNISGIRPAFILPRTAKIDDNNNIIG